MRILGINRTCEASITIFDKGNHVVSVQKERLSRIKHDGGSLGDIELYSKYIKELSAPFDVIVESYSSDKEIENKSAYAHELAQNGLTTENTIFTEISHHLSHLYCVLPHIGNKEYGVIVADSIGSKISELNTEEYPTLHRDIGNYEICSYYVVKNGEYSCISKQAINLENRDLFGIGRFYSNLRKALFPGQGNEGKVMGLAAFGNYSRFQKYGSLNISEGHVSVPENLYSLLAEYRDKNSEGQLSFQDKADLAAFGQRLFEDAYSQMASWLLKKIGTKNLALVGGCALNCVSNGKLIRRINGLNLYVPPAPNDGGTSLGAALFGLNLAREECNFTWFQDYLGPKYDITDITILNKLKGSGLNYRKSSELPYDVAKLLLSGNVVALYQGQSEFGPRALGNRSILCDSRYECNKSYINLFVKGREWFRPVAPMVLAEDVKLYFKTGIQKEYPHMLHTLPVTKNKKKEIMAVSHPDGRMRIQTVSKEDNSLVHEILTNIKKFSNNSSLANTSFNGPGETIVETIDQAINCFKKNKIHYLIIPPYIIKSDDDLILTTNL